jgi:hypothetical protein
MMRDGGSQAGMLQAIIVATLLGLASDGWSMDPVLLEKDTLPFQGSFYEHSGNCYILTVKHGSEKRLVAFSMDGVPPARARGSEVFRGSGDLDLAVYEAPAENKACKAPWPRTASAVELLRRKLRNQAVTLRLAGETGRVRPFQGLVLDVDREHLCVKYDGGAPPDGFSGSLIVLGDVPLGMILGYGRCGRQAETGFSVIRIDIVERELQAANLAPGNRNVFERVRYGNGLYSGLMVEGRPSAELGEFYFSAGGEEPRGGAEEWKIVGRFVDGVPDGSAKLVGPLAEDNLTQECDITFAKGRIQKGSCDLYFSSYLSRVGVDPRLQQQINQFGRSRLEAALRDGHVKCADDGCTQYYGGETSFRGRYRGGVRGGTKTLFEASDRLLPRLTEEYLVLEGDGVFFDTGLATFCFVNCDRVVAEGPNTYEGRWVNGSMLGDGKVTMNHGAVLRGQFRLNTLVSGEAVAAKANMFGLAHNMGYGVYSGPIVNGFPHGKGGRKEDAFARVTIVGEFREGLAWNAEMWWEKDGKKYYCKWVENQCSKKVRLP